MQNDVHMKTIPLLCRVRNIIKSDSNPDESEVENMIKIGQLLIADLRKGLESLNSVFKE